MTNYNFFDRFVLSLTSANLVSSVVVVGIQAARILSRLLRITNGTPQGSCLIVTSGNQTTVDWLCRSARVITTLSVEAAILSVLIIAVDR